MEIKRSKSLCTGASPNFEQCQTCAGTHPAQKHQTNGPFSIQIILCAFFRLPPPSLSLFIKSVEPSVWYTHKWRCYSRLTKHAPFKSQNMKKQKIKVRITKADKNAALFSIKSSESKVLPQQPRADRKWEKKKSPHKRIIYTHPSNGNRSNSDTRQWPQSPTAGPATMHETHSTHTHGSYESTACGVLRNFITQILSKI